jgi:hypothetical protein
VSMSHALEDVRSESTTGTVNTGGNARSGGNGNAGSGNRNGEVRYGYGRFIGVDGKAHVGIERQSRVIPLQSQNPYVRRRRWDLKAWMRERRNPEPWI